MGIRILLLINPGKSLEGIGTLPIFSASDFVMLKVSSVVASPLTISTNFITGTGFIKCMPITFSGLFVADAILVMDMDEVFELNITLFLQI